MVRPAPGLTYGTASPLLEDDSVVGEVGGARIGGRIWGVFDAREEPPGEEGVGGWQETGDAGGVVKPVGVGGGGYYRS